MIDEVKRILNAETCMICGSHAKDNLLRQVDLLRIGSLRKFAQVETKNEKCLNEIQSYFCRSCLSMLPILTYNKFWQSDKKHIQVMSIFSYENPIKPLIIQLKFYQKHYLAKFLSVFIFLIRQNYLQENTNSIFVPIPLHQNRFKERGYNQSELIALEISRLTGIKYDNKILLRTKNTNRQTETKNYEDRLRNMKDAFVLDETYLLENIDLFSKKRIILIDDVLTTGSTIESAASPLISKGFEVAAITIAREDLNYFRLHD